MSTALALLPEVNAELARVFYFPPAAKEGGLRTQVLELELLADTVAELDAEDLDADTREQIGRELCDAIHGTREKVDVTARTLAYFEAAAEAAQKEAQRLTERQHYFERQGERLTKYVLAVIDVSKVKKLDGYTSTLKAQKNPPALEIAPGTVVPPEFMRTPDPPPPPAPAPDKNLIKKAIIGGATIEGCSLKNSTRLVRS